MGVFKAAAVQMRSGVDPAKNAVDFEDLVRDAAGQGAQYVQTPEMTGALVRDKSELLAMVQPQERDPIAAVAKRLAADLGIFLHVGSTAIARPDGKVANRAFLFDPKGSLIATYDKIHMFDVDLDKGETWRESATYEPGAGAVVTDLPFARLGFAVCYDLRFPQLYRALAQAGAVMLAVPSSFQRETGPAHWHTLLRTRAIENAAWVIAPAMCGDHPNGRSTYGHSLIVDPWGRVVAELEDEPGVLVTEVDLAQVAKVRAMLPSLEHDRAFELERMEPRPGTSGVADSQ